MSNQGIDANVEEYVRRRFRFRQKSANFAGNSASQ